MGRLPRFVFMHNFVIVRQLWVREELIRVAFYGLALQSRYTIVLFGNDYSVRFLFLGVGDGLDSHFGQWAQYYLFGELLMTNC